MKKKNFIFGISGAVLTNKEEEFLSEFEPLGIILFKRNIENPEQLKNLITSIKEIVPGGKIFVDQEGGRVQRIKFTKNYPTAMSFAEIYKENQEKAIKAIEENFTQIMSELKAFNIDSPCAPVADLFFEGAHSIIGDRSFGSGPKQVAVMCKVAINAINQLGGIAFVKHIPGHGRATKDSHFDLPTVNTDLKTLEETDFKVFKELANENVWGMTAHIVYNALDKKKPITLSSKAVKYIRENIGFKGMLVTDDICMKALHPNGEITFEQLKNISNEAFDAGCDAVLHCSGALEEMKAIVS